MEDYLREKILWLLKQILIAFCVKIIIEDRILPLIKTFINYCWDILKRIIFLFRYRLDKFRKRNIWTYKIEGMVLVMMLIFGATVFSYSIFILKNNQIEFKLFNKLITNSIVIIYYSIFLLSDFKPLKIGYEMLNKRKIIISINNN